MTNDTLAPLLQVLQSTATQPGYPGTARTGLVVGTLSEIGADGVVTVFTEAFGPLQCDCLVSGWGAAVPLAPGDTVLASFATGATRPIVLGRVGPHRPQPDTLTLCAAESLSLRCGASSLELKADGKVLLKGDDVVVRAKGTQRIRAGHVAIN